MSTGGDDAKRQVIDPATSTITWEGKKVTGSHNGDIQMQSGFLSTEKGLITGATVIIDMTSINTTDLEGGSKESLDGHLKSDDFFGTAQFPTAQFELTSLNPIRAENGMNFAAQGTVTIKGRTVEVSFPVKVEIGDASTTISGEMVLDRSDLMSASGASHFLTPPSLGTS